MAPLDWFIVGLYTLIALIVGVWFTNKATRSMADFFVAGRSLPWFIAGTSIVATTFSSDTPLVVAGISRSSGISGHWFWLSAAIGQVATVFFFARLWRRSELMTDIEFVVKRYGPSRAAAALRIFRVFFDAVLINGIVMASVTLAMAKIMKAVTSLPDTGVFHLPVFGDVTWAAILLLALGCTVLLYSLLSGLYGVVYTDLLQFVLAVTGSVLLAVLVYIDASKGPGLIKKLSAAPGFKPSLMNFFPEPGSFSLETFTFLVYVSVTWLPRAPGNGYYVQRLLATRSERDSVLAFLWFNICQYVIRPWPWIIVGLLSLYYLPHLPDAEDSFPAMINLFLPVGLKGVMVASLLAAFMSTIDTHLNWAASYIVNDFYQPFISSGKSTKHYVFVSRLVMAVLMAIALLLTTKLTSLLGAYKYLGVISSGIATVMIARWYWWRVNAWSEISALITSLVVANYLEVKMPSTASADLFAVRVLVTTLVVTLVWVSVTFLTSPAKPDEHTTAFYLKMRVAGPGWKKVRDATATKQETGQLTQSLIAWLTCLCLIFSLTLGCGAFLLHKWSSGVFCIAVAIASGCSLKRLMCRTSTARFLKTPV